MQRAILWLYRASLPRSSQRGRGWSGIGGARAVLHGARDRYFPARFAYGLAGDAGGRAWEHVENGRISSGSTGRSLSSASPASSAAEEAGAQGFVRRGNMRRLREVKRPRAPG